MTTFFAIVIILAGVTIHIKTLKGSFAYIFRLEVEEKRHERELKYRLELQRIESQEGKNENMK